MNLKKISFSLGLLLCLSIANAETLNSKIVGVSTTDNARKIEQTCLTLLKNKEYEKLENYAKSLDTSENSAKDDSGHIQIYACMNGITEKKQDLILWTKHSPKNIYPYLANNYDSVRIFFNLRGEKAMSETNQDSYKKAQDVLTYSANELDYAKKFGATGLWYDERIRIAFYREEENLFNLFKQGSNKFPQYYPIYLAVTASMRPQWGFPYEILANTSFYAVQKTKNPEIYARIYTQMVNPCCSQKISDTKTINYDLLRAGVSEIIKKYPSTFNYNKMAQTACLLKDKELYKYLIKEMKTNKKPIVSDLWFSGKDYECQSIMSEK